MNSLENMTALATGYDIINGVKYPRRAWSDLTKEYPGKWIIYANPKNVDDERLFICTVLSICDNSTVDSERVRIIKDGIKSCAMKTDDDYVGGSII